MSSKDPDRRDFLARGAALAGGMAIGAVQPGIAQSRAPDQSVEPQDWSSPELIAYGERSHFVTSIRTPHTMPDRSPDEWGLVMHVAAPLQDSVGVITPSSLHYVATTRGSLVPEIDPREHRLVIHGMVDRELVFTMEELKRLPSVSRIHFIECNGNRPTPRDRTVQDTHGMTSCAEWTGVLLSTLLNEAGVREGGEWIVAEGVENVRGASSIPTAKAMDDCIVCYGMNGEPVRSQQGFPLRLLVPGYEGIYSVKWLRRIEVVDQFYMTYNDYGHLVEADDPERAVLWRHIGPKSVITFPSGGHELPGRGFYEISGLAWSGGGVVRRVEVSTDGGRSWRDAEIKGTPLPMAHTRFGFQWNWDGTETVLMSRCTDELGQVQPTRAQVAEFWGEPPGGPLSVKGMDNSIQPWRVDGEGMVHNAI